jgi:hypothetical protein
LIFGAVTLDFVGASYRILGVLILSFALAIAGAVVAMRALVEFLAERI